MSSTKALQPLESSDCRLPGSTLQPAGGYTPAATGTFRDNMGQRPQAAFQVISRRRPNTPAREKRWYRGRTVLYLRKNRAFGQRMESVARRRKSPQDKKRLSYAKDRRNNYGENDKSSRKNVRRNKRYPNRANRHQARQDLHAATGALDQTQGEIAQERLDSRKPKRWAKSPDEPLGLILEWRLQRRVCRGIDSPQRAEASIDRIRRRMGAAKSGIDLPRLRERQILGELGRLLPWHVWVDVEWLWRAGQEAPAVRMLTRELLDRHVPLTREQRAQLAALAGSWNVARGANDQ